MCSSDLKSLQSLDLDKTSVTDVGLKELAELKSLQTLDVSETGVTDAGLKELNELKDLQWLDLSRTKVTDAGLMQLKGLKRLKSMYLGDTEVTEAGIKAIEEALPGVKIHREDPFDVKLPNFDFSSPDLPWPMLLILGVIVLVGAMAAGVYKARHPD